MITVRDLNNVGRFGNQLFTYVFAKAYAERMNCELQVGNWIGRQIFTNANEPLVTVRLPQIEPETNGKPLGYFFGQQNIDIKIYAQHQKYLDFYSRSQVQKWLAIKPEFDCYAIDEPVYSAAHLRRGDYVNNPWMRTKYCEVSETSYNVAIKKFSIPSPLFKVFEGWRPPFQELDKRGLGFLPDFLALRNATHLLRGNSSFSVWASWLGNGKTYSPIVGTKAGLNDCEFVEGNWPCTAGQFSNQSDLHLKE